MFGISKYAAAQSAQLSLYNINTAAPRRPPSEALKKDPVSKSHPEPKPKQKEIKQQYPNYQPMPGVKSILLQRQNSSTTSTDLSASMRSSKEVSFHEIHVSEYDIRLGDSPYAEGPPMSLGLQKVQESKYSVQDFETLRAQKSTRKGGLRLSSYERSNLLLSHGYSLTDIASAVIATEQARAQLAVSLQDRRWDSFRGVQESAARSLRIFKIRAPRRGSNNGGDTTGTPSSKCRRNSIGA